MHISIFWYILYLLKTKSMNALYLMQKFRCFKNYFNNHSKNESFGKLLHWIN